MAKILNTFLTTCLTEGRAASLLRQYMKLTHPLLDSEYSRFCEIAQANRKAECFVSDEIQVLFFYRKRDQDQGSRIFVYENEKFFSKTKYFMSSRL
jgi:predicted transcriptional regulator